MTDRRRPPRRPDPEHIARLNQLAAWRLEWSRKHRDRARFRARGAESDYNQHNLDIDGASAAAEDEFHARAREIMGIDEGRR